MLNNFKLVCTLFSFCLMRNLVGEIVTRGNGGSGYILRFAVTDPETYNDSVAKGGLNSPSKFESVHLEDAESLKLCQEFYYYVDESLRIYQVLRPQITGTSKTQEKLLPANLLEAPLRKDLNNSEKLLLRDLFKNFKKKNWNILCSKNKMRFGFIASEIEPRYAFSAANYIKDASLALNPYQWKDSPYLDDALCSQMESLRNKKTPLPNKNLWCSQRFKLAIAFHEIVTLFWTSKEESNQYFDSALFVRNPIFLEAELKQRSMK